MKTFTFWAMQAAAFALCWIFSHGLGALLDLTHGQQQNSWGVAFMLALGFYSVAAHVAGLLWRRIWA